MSKTLISVELTSLYSFCKFCILMGGTSKQNLFMVKSTMVIDSDGNE